MNRVNRRIIGLLVGFPSMILGLAFIVYFSVEAVSFKLGILLIGVGLTGILWVNQKKLTNLYLLFNSLVFAYLLTEGILYLNQPYDSYSGYDAYAAKYDPNLGYHWEGQGFRYFKYVDNTVIFDNQVNLNQQRQVAGFDYQRKKSDSIKRYLLFGDSFSEGIMLEHNLVNRINEYNQSKSNANYELYAFACDGGGIMNWYGSFKQLVTQYEFDGIIFTSYMDNLYRDYMVLHLSKQVTLIGRLADLPKVFNAKELKSKGLDERKLVFSDEEIKAAQNSPSKTFEWTAKKTIVRLIRKMRESSESIHYKTPQNVKQLKRKIGESHWQAFEEIVTYCRQNGKDIVFATVPSRELLKTDTINFHQKESEILIKEFDLVYFDGYQVFNQFNANQIDDLWFKHDGHWNQRGADLYAKAIDQLLTKRVKELD